MPIDNFRDEMFNATHATVGKIAAKLNLNPQNPNYAIALERYIRQEKIDKKCVHNVLINSHAKVDFNFLFFESMDNLFWSCFSAEMNKNNHQH